MKIIRLTCLPGKTYVNTKTFRCINFNIYTPEELAKDWVLVDTRNVRKFIEEHKNLQNDTNETIK